MARKAERKGKGKSGRPRDGGAGGGRPVKGFRPGKEPRHVKAQRARAQLGEDASWAQRKSVEAVAGRSPREVEALVKRWTTSLLVATVVLLLLGALLYLWSRIAGVIVHVLAVLALFLWYRLRRQGPNWVAMARSLE